MSKMAVIYWSMTGNTEAMAAAIAQGAQEAGAQADLKQVSEISVDEALTYDLLALGCPAMGAEVLEEAEFEPFFAQLEGRLSGRKVALCADEQEARRMAADLAALTGEECVTLFAREWQLRDRVSASHSFEQERLDALCRMALEQCRAFGAGFAAY